MPGADEPDTVFGPFRLDRRSRGLTRDGVVVPLGGRAFDTLAALAATPGATISKRALLDAVWPSLSVEDNNLQVQISILRKALGEGWIVTVPGRGYCLASSPAADPQVTPAPPGRPSIAVLAFQNIGDDPEQEYFADGMAEDIITALSRIRSFFVTARNSSFTYKGRAVDVRQVGRELGVRYVLEGSVRRGGERVRISAQLVEAETGTHIWAERYDRQLADVFAVQDEISGTVATAIGPAVADAEMHRAIRRAPGSLGAWDLYQRGMWHFSKYDATENEEARRLFAHAIERDPMFAAAHTGLSHATLWAGGTYLTMPLDEATRVGLMHARKAVDLDPGDAGARAELAEALRVQGDMDNAEATARQALAINPNSAHAHYVIGRILIYTGRTAEGRQALGVFERLSPRDAAIPQAHVAIVVSYYFDRDYERCAEAARRQLGARPGSILTYRWLAAALGQLGRAEEARAVLEKLTTLSQQVFDVYFRYRVPWLRPEDYEHVLDGLRKAGWHR